MTLKLENSFPLVCRASRDDLLIYNALHFDQQSRLIICLNIFRFSANNSKTNLKFEKSFPFDRSAVRDKYIDV